MRIMEEVSFIGKGFKSTWSTNLPTKGSISVYHYIMFKNGFLQMRLNLFLWQTSKMGKSFNIVFNLYFLKNVFHKVHFIPSSFIWNIRNFYLITSSINAFGYEKFGERGEERERENKEKLKSSMTANFKHFRLFKFCKLKAEFYSDGIHKIKEMWGIEKGISHQLISRYKFYHSILYNFEAVLQFYKFYLIW